MQARPSHNPDPCRNVVSPGPPSWLRAKYRSFYGLQMAVKEGAENELKAAVTVSD